MTTGVRLLDVNVLVPLLWPPHINHRRAQDWFGAIREQGWATCPLTQLGCTRILATPALSRGAFTVRTAIGRLAEILSETHHQFWADNIPLSDSRFSVGLPYLQGPNQLTDRYLLALAAARDGTFATFDRGIAAGLPADSDLLPHLEVVDG